VPIDHEEEPVERDRCATRASEELAPKVLEACPTRSEAAPNQNDQIKTMGVTSEPRLIARQ